MSSCFLLLCSYRDASEVKQVLFLRDPIIRSRALILERNLATKEELDVSLHVQEDEFYQSAETSIFMDHSYIATQHSHSILCY